MKNIRGKDKFMSEETEVAIIISVTAMKNVSWKQLLQEKWGKTLFHTSLDWRTSTASLKPQMTWKKS